MIYHKKCDNLTDKILESEIFTNKRKKSVMKILKRQKLEFSAALVKKNAIKIVSGQLFGDFRRRIQKITQGVIFGH